MSLTAKEKSGADLEPIPAGVYVAVCYGLIDLGTHHNATFGNEAHKILVQWEVPDVRGDFERNGEKMNLPRAISKRYTLSLSEKATLRRDLESWRGRRFSAQELTGFDLKAILGTACQLQVTHDTNKEGRTFANVAAIMALPRGYKGPKPENPLAFFSFEEEGDQPTMPSDLPEWVQKIIVESREWQAAAGTTAPAPGPATAPAGTAPDAPATTPTPAPAAEEDDDPIPF